MVAPLRIEAVLLSAPVFALGLAAPHTRARQAAFVATGLVVLVMEASWRRAIRARCRRLGRSALLRAALLPPSLAALGAALLAGLGSSVGGVYGSGLIAAAIVSFGLAVSFVLPGLPTPVGRLLRDRRREGLGSADRRTVAEVAAPLRSHDDAAVIVDGSADPADVEELLSFTPTARVVVGDLVVGIVDREALDGLSDPDTRRGVVDVTRSG